MKFEIKSRNKEKYIMILIFGMAVIWLFYQIYPVMFATHDDILSYVKVRRGILLPNAFDDARSGRISQLWNQLLLGIPYIANSVSSIKTIFVLDIDESFTSTKLIVCREIGDYVLEIKKPLTL